MTDSFKTFLTSYENESRRIDNQNRETEVAHGSQSGDLKQGTAVFREFSPGPQGQGGGGLESLLSGLFGAPPDSDKWDAFRRILHTLSDQNKMDADALMKKTDLPVFTFMDSLDTLQKTYLVSVQDNQIALTPEGETVTELGVKMGKTMQMLSREEAEQLLKEMKGKVIKARAEREREETRLNIETLRRRETLDEWSTTEK